jgi:hypothetical protein
LKQARGGKMARHVPADRSLNIKNEQAFRNATFEGGEVTLWVRSDDFDPAGHVRSSPESDRNSDTAKDR